MDASGGGDDPTDATVDGNEGIATDGGDEIATGGGDEIPDGEVVRTAAEAAERVIFSRYDRSEVTDLDVSVSFEDGVLEVDVYVDADGDDPDQVADDAALAARGAVDDLFDEP